VLSRQTEYIEGPDIQRSNKGSVIDICAGQLLQTVTDTIKPGELPVDSHILSLFSASPDEGYEFQGAIFRVRLYKWAADCLNMSPKTMYTRLGVTELQGPS
jgi:hypothetical protein